MAAALTASACTRPAAPPDRAARQTPTPTGRSTAGAPARACDPASKPVTPDGPSARAVTLSPGGNGQPRIEAVVYPRPAITAGLWSQWGQGLVLPDGRVLSGAGDHLGVDGNSYLFIYDPATKQLTRFADMLSTIGHQQGDWGFGKIHGQLVAISCDEVYLSTYWGTRVGLTFGPTYDGDVLLRLDTRSLALEPLGVPIPRHGIPSLAGWAPGGLLYGEAVEPATERGLFFVYDIASRRVVFRAEEPAHSVFRNVMVDSTGGAYFSGNASHLFSYRPGDQRVRVHDPVLPGRVLRSSTRPAPDGTVYGVTREPDLLFALRPSGAIDPIRAVRGYVASLAVDPSGRYVYYVPDAFGRSWTQGTPLIRVETATGEETVVAELNELAERHLGLRFGGTYNVAFDPSGEILYLGMNAGPAPAVPEPRPVSRGSATGAFGDVALVIVKLA